MKKIILAINFLTIIPLKYSGDLGEGDLGRSAAWFGVIGTGIGAFVWGGFWLARQVFSPTLAAIITVAVWVILTGGLHLDGLADCCDGLLASTSPERRLEIMKDSRIGSFGALGLLLTLMLKTAAISTLRPGAFFPFILAAASARWLILPLALNPAARPGGMGASFKVGLDKPVFVLAALLPLSLALGSGWVGVLAFVLAHGLTLAISRLARARIGGITGDVFGLQVELTETFILLVFAAQWKLG